MPSCRAAEVLAPCWVAATIRYLINTHCIDLGGVAMA
ncbi:hypothetical protein FRAAL6762 [Frankia alni ACN14a]|uniref:Uncharacterized protein n=1 Tax=Frankia alni (strain DSM 45986 / CECT 9034 / ACN14a) TaxID=326424 RepID=Q0RB03_FRAAA|nr:hypothetical protein FRAAL6762 [Frankia alni ACN14a]